MTRDTSVLEYQVHVLVPGTVIRVRMSYVICMHKIRLFGRTGDVTALNVVVPIHVAAMMTCKFTQRRNLTFSSLISVDILFNLGSR